MQLMQRNFDGSFSLQVEIYLQDFHGNQTFKGSTNTLPTSIFLIT